MKSILITECTPNVYEIKDMLYAYPTVKEAICEFLKKRGYKRETYHFHMEYTGVRLSDAMDVMINGEVQDGQFQ